MALLNFTGFELGPTTNRILEAGAYSTPDGFINVVGSGTTDPHDGDYCLKISGDGTTTRSMNLEAILNTTANEAGDFGAPDVYVNFWFKYDTKVSTGHEMILRVFGAAQKAYLGLNSSGKLDLYDESGNLQASGISALGAGTWYKIQLKIGTEGAGGGDADYELRINGIQEYVGSDGNMGSLGAAYIQLGNPSRKSSDAFTYYYDDIAVSDSAFINPKIYRLDPNNQDAGTGISNDWDTVPAQSSDEQYLNCDEIPNDGNTSYIKGNIAYGATPHSSSWRVEDATGTIPVDAEIVGVKITGICYDPATVGIDSHGKIWIYVGASQWDPMSGYVDFPESYYDSLSLLATQEPIGTSDWTLADIDSIVVGIETQDNLSDNSMPRCTWLGIQVVTNQEEEQVFVRRTLIAGNTVEGAGSAGLSVSTTEDANAPGAYDQITIVGNIFRNNYQGIQLDSNTTGYIAGGSGSVIRGNLCYENTIEGMDFEGGPSGTEDKYYLNHVAVMGNVSGDDGTGSNAQSYGIRVEGKTENCVFLGNICIGNTISNIENGAEDPLANEFSHNIEDD